MYFLLLIFFGFIFVFYEFINDIFGMDINDEYRVEFFAVVGGEGWFDSYYKVFNLFVLFFGVVF